MRGGRGREGRECTSEQRPVHALAPARKHARHYLRRCVPALSPASHPTSFCPAPGQPQVPRGCGLLAEEAWHGGPGAERAQGALGKGCVVDALLVHACLAAPALCIRASLHRPVPALPLLQVWKDVQRKWQALESIFVGSADIRVQLPEDSKRFDAVNADYVVGGGCCRREVSTSSRQRP